MVKTIEIEKELHLIPDALFSCVQDFFRVANYHIHIPPSRKNQSWMNFRVERPVHNKPIWIVVKAQRGTEISVGKYRADSRLGDMTVCMISAQKNLPGIYKVSVKVMREELYDLFDLLAKSISKRFGITSPTQPRDKKLAVKHAPKPQIRMQDAIHQLSVKRVDTIKKTGKVPDLKSALGELGDAIISVKQMRRHARDLNGRWRDKTYRAIWKYNEEKKVWEVSE